MADLSPVPDGAPRRGRVPLRDIAEVVLPSAILLLVLVNVALTIGGGGDRPFEEWGFVTILSSVALATAGVLSLVCFACHQEPRSFGRWFWALAGVGFLFFAVDELLQGHEKAGDKLEIQYGAAPLFRNWNDAIVLSYGVIALILVVVFRREVLRWRGVAELLAIGALFFVLHTGIDALVDGQYKTQVEESMKLAANTFFALGMLAAAQATRSSWSARWPTSALRRGPTPRGTASPASGGSPVP